MKRKIIGILLVFCLIFSIVAAVPTTAATTAKMLKCVLGTSSNTSLTHYGQFRTPTFELTAGKIYDVSFDYFLDGSIHGGMDYSSKCYAFMCSDARGDLGHLADSSNEVLAYFVSNERHRFTATYVATATRSDMRLTFRFLYDGNLYLANFSVVEHGTNKNLVTNSDFSNGLAGYFYIGGGQQGTFGVTATGDFADIYQVVSFGAPLGEGGTDEPENPGEESDEPDDDTPVYQIDFANYTASNGYPVVVLALNYNAMGAKVNVSFDYYLPQAILQTMMKNVASGRDLTDAATGTHLLQQGVHHFSFSDSSFDNACFSPGVQMGNIAYGNIYIWNYEASVNGVALVPKVHINDAPVYEIEYSDIPFEGTSIIQSVEGTTVTLKAQSGYEYSKDGEIFQESNVFENLEYDVQYTFCSRKVGTADIGKGSVVLIPSAPVVQVGETRLVVQKNPSYEYSLDGEKWVLSNAFGNLTANTQYTVYRRLLVKGMVYPVSSAGTVVCTNGHDRLPNEDAASLMVIINAILADKNDYAADVNGDQWADVRDLVNLKKRIAGLLMDEYDTVPANIRAYLEEAEFYDTSDYTYSKANVGSYIHPQAVTLSYTVDLPETATAAVISVSPNADMSNATVYNFNTTAVRTGTVTANVYHLFTGAVYYWQASVARTGGVTETSSIKRFKVKDGVRFINTASVDNMRDVGGWQTLDGKTVKQGLVYRSAQLDRVSVADKELLLNQFGIRYEIDLRRTDENGNMTASPLGTGVDYLNVPSGSYGGYFSDPAKAALVFREFADGDNYPIVFHCVGGADRTGTLAVMLKALLGVGENDLTADFELTPGRQRKRGEGSNAWIDFPGLMTTLKALPGDTIQEKAYRFYHERAGMSAMELSNIYNIMMTDSAVFESSSLAVPTVTSGNDVSFDLNMRGSSSVVSVELNGTAANYTYANGTLTVQNVSGGGTVTGTVTLNDGAKLSVEIKIQ